MALLTHIFFKNMSKRIVYIIILTITLGFLYSCKEDTYSTKSSVYGIIMDAKDNTPIEGAMVTNQTTGKNCITPKDGCYEFNNLEFNKTYEIYVEKDGYIPTKQFIMSSDVRDRIELNIRLSKRP